MPGWNCLGGSTPPRVRSSAKRLLIQMAGRLTACHAGITRVELRWKHDFHGAKDIPDWGGMEIRTAHAT